MNKFTSDMHHEKSNKNGEECEKSPLGALQALHTLWFYLQSKLNFKKAGFILFY